MAKISKDDVLGYLESANMLEISELIKNIEDKLQVRVMLIGTGPLVDDIIDIRFD